MAGPETSIPEILKIAISKCVSMAHPVSGFRAIVSWLHSLRVVLDRKCLSQKGGYNRKVGGRIEGADGMGGAVQSAVSCWSSIGGVAALA